MLNTDKFNFFVPAHFEKSGESGEMRIKGVCSTIVEDSDGETLDPTGFDFQPLLSSGFYNWNHQGAKNPGAILGRPTLAKVINNGREFYTEGFLYKGSEEARAVFQLAQVLENEDPERRLGFSIEGQALERDPINPKRIRKARITGIAITHCPKNPNTLLSIIKGQYSEPFVEERQPVILTKSEVYDQIFGRYTNNIDQSKQIYSFIQTVSEKLFNMEKQSITADVLNKAFELLDQSIHKSEDSITTTTTEKEVVDSTTTTTTTEQEESEDEKLEKALKKQSEMESLAKSLLESGKTKGEIIDDMVSKGCELEETKNTVEKVLSQFKEQQDGGSIQQISKSLELLTDSIHKSFEHQDTLLKGLVNELNPRFKALGEILKSQVEENSILKTKLSSLQENFTTLSERLQTVESEPNIRKSVTTTAIERFNTDTTVDSNTFNISKSEERSLLSQRLMSEFEKGYQIGRPDQRLERAIMDLEISKSLPTSILPVLSSLGIKIVQ